MVILAIPFSGKVVSIHDVEDDARTKNRLGCDLNSNNFFDQEERDKNIVFSIVLWAVCYSRETAVVYNCLVENIIQTPAAIEFDFLFSVDAVSSVDR